MKPLYSNANYRSTESELDRIEEGKRVPTRVADTRLIPLHELSFARVSINHRLAPK